MGRVVIFMGWGVGRVKIHKNTKLGENTKLSTILAVSYRVIDGMRFKVREGMGQLKILDLNFAKLTHVENNLKIKRLYRIFFFSLVKCNTPHPPRRILLINYLTLQSSHNINKVFIGM